MALKQRKVPLELLEKLLAYHEYAAAQWRAERRELLERIQRPEYKPNPEGELTPDFDPLDADERKFKEEQEQWLRAGTMDDSLPETDEKPVLPKLAQPGDING